MENPYAAPESVITPIPVSNTASEQIRQAHLSHEASVKSVGSLYYLGALLLSLGFLSFLAFSLTAHGSGRMDVSILIVTSLLILALIVLQVKLAGGLRDLRPWVRIPTIILSIIGLFGFPIGTLISAYVLYLMLSGKSTMVFSAEYRQIVAETPHLRYRSSLLRTVLIVILVMAAFMGLAIYFRANP